LVTLESGTIARITCVLEKFAIHRGCARSWQPIETSSQVSD
jgi:hypothetical protein